MTPPPLEVLREEARRAWRAEARRVAFPGLASVVLLCAVIGAGAFTVAAVSWRLSLLFDGRPAAAAMLALGGALACALVLVPAAIARRRAARARSVVDGARARRASGRCRCGAPIASTDEPGPRRCGCGARLLEAEGLIIVYASEPGWRALRWRAQARARLGRHALASWPLSPAFWTAVTAGALGGLWSTAAALGGPSTVGAPLALDRQVSLHGTARASEEPARPSGAVTRDRAPLSVGTQALARRGPGPHHELAVIVRAAPPRAFVVYASGASGWVHERDLLAAELAPGDAVEVRDRGRYVAMELRERVGPAMRVQAPDGTERWTDASQVRVRSDAAHAAGRGRSSHVPPSAWIEAWVNGVLRPGVQVVASADRRRVRVVLGDGSARWLPLEHVRPQVIGPGVTVRVDGAARPRIVAARIGHALCIVDARGERSWTALSRVRRSDAPEQAP